MLEPWYIDWHWQQYLPDGTLVCRWVLQNRPNWYDLRQDQSLTSTCLMEPWYIDWSCSWYQRTDQTGMP
jgi:hypothetical protein